jgi:FkbM family methyltransferase
MSFISYAQNFEDVLLWRALGHVPRGFYIDVGANDPVEHSVTKAFYDAGWSGISIEPLMSYHRAFVEQRPRDINLAVAAGASDGTLTLYDVPAVRGWASPDPIVAERHQAEGYEVAELTVPVRTLASICADHASGGIHFLKIDVEGFEGEVLRGMDFARWRPWVLVIEATLPGSRVTNHESWEHLVVDAGYRFAWFDGLNRYYVAAEHPELMAAFTVPPNVFDDFISHHLDKAWAAKKELARALDEATQPMRTSTEALRASEAHGAVLAVEMHDASRRAEYLQEQLDRAVTRLETAEDELRALRAELQETKVAAYQAATWGRSLEERLLAIFASTSWRITEPLRRTSEGMRALRQSGFRRRAVGRITSSQRLRRIAIPILLRYPALGARVSAWLAASRAGVPAPGQAPGVPDALRALPASARTVLADLLRARANDKGG